MELSVFAFVLFTLEAYHVVTHTSVLYGWRLLPRRDLVKVRPYFLIDTSTVALTAFLVTGKHWLLASLQIVQHLTYFFTWDKSSFAKRVINWSSLEWKQSRLQWDLVLGTAFDILVHVVNVWQLAYMLSVEAMVIASVLVGILVRMILLNPKFAWSDPANIPSWIQRRLQQEATVN